jgi:hypothetical protein
MEKEFSRRAFSIGLARFLLMLGGVSIAQNNAPKTSSASPSAKNAKKSALRKCSIEDKVKQIIGEQLGVAESEVKPAANLVHDLGSDSLDCVALITSRLMQSAKERFRRRKKSTPRQDLARQKRRQIRGEKPTRCVCFCQNP